MRFTRFSKLVVLGAMTLVVAYCGTASAQHPPIPGLDSTFGNQGFALSKPLGGTAYPWNMTTGNGKIIESTSVDRTAKRKTSSTLVLTEFDSTGKPVKAFGHSGVARYGLGMLFWWHYVAIDSHGRIVLLIGEAPDGNVYRQHLVVVRLRANGAPDHGFNHGTPLELTSGDDYIGAGFSMSPDGRIFVYNASLNQDAALFAVTSHGRLDRSYGHNGQAVLTDPSTDPVFDPLQWSFAEVSDDGSVFMDVSRNGPKVSVPGVGSFTSKVPTILKLTPNGKPDESFGVHGQLSIPSPEVQSYISDLSVAKNGTINTVLRLGTPNAPSGHTSTWHEILKRFDANGAPSLSSPSIASEFPIPATAVKGVRSIDLRFNDDGSLDRLESNDSRRVFELTHVSSDGSQVDQSAPITLPRVPFRQFGPSVLDPIREGAFLVGGGLGKRFSVIRLRPAS